MARVSACESMKKSIVVVGLGFGDEGKGSIVDALTQKKETKTIVRFNGGPQAAHHVVRDNGAWHCFSQFSSGMFSKDTSRSKYCSVASDF